MGPIKSDHFKRLITLTVITLSGLHCYSHNSNISQQIIVLKFLFLGMTKLLVAAGSGSGTRLASMEIINLDYSNPNLICENLPNLAVPISSPTGKLFTQKHPILCGGNDPTRKYCDCHSFGSKSWQSIPSLKECKYGSSSAVIQNPNVSGNEMLLVTGGYTGTVVTTVETFDGNLWNQTMFAKLPTPIFFHCLEKINDTMLLQIGGSLLGSPPGTTSNTFFLDIVQNKWISG
jgi:hypothetical protein